MATRLTSCWWTDGRSEWEGGRRKEGKGEGKGGREGGRIEMNINFLITFFLLI